VINPDKQITEMKGLFWFTFLEVSNHDQFTHFFGPTATQYIRAGAHGKGSPSTPWSGVKEKEEIRVSQSPSGACSL
jgi:hypothetical protein